MARIIGLRHRRKRTTEGEARPTVVAIKEGDTTNVYELPDDTAELDFLMGRFPLDWRAVEGDEPISGYLQHHCKWRRVKPEDNLTGVSTHHIRRWIDLEKKAIVEVVTKVPCVFEGLTGRDQVAAILGGSGDRFAYALSRRGEEIGARVYRIPPFLLKVNRDAADKEDDHLTLISLFATQPDLFYHLGRRDRALIAMVEAYRARMDAMRGRIACEQRVIQSAIGRIFLDPEGRYPEGVIEDQYDEQKANDKILQALLAEEERREKELKKAAQGTDGWQEVGASIEGLGERIFAGLMSAIGDVRRFWVYPDYSGIPEEDIERRKRLAQKADKKGQAKLKAFCGVHVLVGGKHGNTPTEKQFPRRRRGQTSNWNPDARQALYLLLDQFNRRPKSEWGKKLLFYKQRLRQAHPDVVTVEVTENGKKARKKRYTNGHIHKMAKQRTATRFVEFLWRRLTELERASAAEATGEAPEAA